MTIRTMILPVSALVMIAIPLTAAAAHQSRHGSHEPILSQPIGGIENNFWFDYLSDIREAEHELKKDLKRATDDEDRRDAREEYRNEIADANKDYTKEMRERGYRVGRVTVGG
ncbi:hypothetical protein [Parasphingorhabdus sp.]|uniref:hypothetical protein n=1 Tax=Parasphingorhabdus sp. TaxID=2709688 RepID=UPI0032636DEC